MFVCLYIYIYSSLVLLLRNNTSPRLVMKYSNQLGLHIPIN